MLRPGQGEVLTQGAAPAHGRDAVHGAPGGFGSETSAPLRAKTWNEAMGFTGGFL